VWLAAASVVVAAVGVALYPFVLARFDLRNLRRGEGEHWVAGGSLAICSLAFAEIASAAGRISSLHSSVRLWRDIALALWVLAMLWLPILIACELRWPRWRYSDSRWVTVFPLGMYAVCSFQLASATSTAGIADFARIWTWVAVAAWLAVSAGLIHRIGPRELRPRLAARS
jgi:tellurite resistance protein TehA-like permease